MIDTALLRLIEDVELAKSLQMFFEAQATIETVASAEMLALDHPDTELARKHACYAKAYEEAMNRLRAYARQI